MGEAQEAVGTVPDARPSLPGPPRGGCRARSVCRAPRSPAQLLTRISVGEAPLRILWRRDVSVSFLRD